MGAGVHMSPHRSGMHVIKKAKPAMQSQWQTEVVKMQLSLATLVEEFAIRTENVLNDTKITDVTHPTRSEIQPIQHHEIAKRRLDVER
jgi:hypothetical protein